MRLLTQIFEIVEPIMNSPLNRKIITFFMRNIKLGKVTRFLEEFSISLGG